MENKTKGTNGKKMTIIVGAVIAVIAIIVGTITLVGSSKGNVDDNLSLGNTYLTEMDYDQAIAAFEKVLKVDPQNEAALKGIGDAYVGKASTLPSDDYANREAALEKALQYDPTNETANTEIVEVTISMSTAYMADNKMQDAANVLDRVFQLTQNDQIKEELDKIGGMGFGPSSDTEGTGTGTGTDNSSEATGGSGEWDETFKSEIADAVGVPEDQLTEDVLASITSITILGDQFVSTDPNFEYNYRLGVASPEGGSETLEGFYTVGRPGEGEMYTTKGNLTSIAGIENLVNLSDISIIANHITDLSPLEKLTKLEYVNFFANDITDTTMIEKYCGEYNTQQEQFIEIGDEMEASES